MQFEAQMHEAVRVAASGIQWMYRYRRGTQRHCTRRSQPLPHHACYAMDQRDNAAEVPAPHPRRRREGREATCGSTAQSDWMPLTCLREGVCLAETQFHLAAAGDFLRKITRATFSLFVQDAIKGSRGDGNQEQGARVCLTSHTHLCYGTEV